MGKSVKIILALIFVALISVLIIQTFYSLDRESENELALKSKDKIIDGLENTIKQLEEKSQLLLKDFEDIIFIQDEQKKI